jgi:hypothetical protein
VDVDSKRKYRILEKVWGVVLVEVDLSNYNDKTTTKDGWERTGESAGRWPKNESSNDDN